MRKTILSILCIALALTAVSQNVGIGTSSPGSTLQVSGSFAAAYTAYTASTTLASTDRFVAYTATTATSATFTLPAYNSGTNSLKGREYVIKNNATAAATIATGTAYQIGNTVTASPGSTSFSSTMYPGTITFSGYPTQIITAASSTALTVSSSQTVGSSGTGNGVSYTIEYNEPALTIKAAGSETIDNVSSITIYPGYTITLVSTGATSGNTWTVVTTASASSSTTGWATTGNAGTIPSLASIGTAVNNNFIGTTDPNDFVLATNSLERMRINSAGYVGIGTNSPHTPLEVSAAANELLKLTNTASMAGAYSYIDFLTFIALAGASNNNVIARIGALDMGSNNGSIVFETGNQGTASTTTTERMRILNTGNVGIGTTNPAGLFTVGSGTASPFQINSSGAITAATGITSSGTVTFSGLSAGGVVYANTSGTLAVATGTNLPAGSGSYIQNTTTQQSSSNFNISGAGVIGGNATVSGGTLSLGSSTSNTIAYSNYGLGVPSFTTTSLGTKLNLFAQEDATDVNYSVGIAASTLWYAIPQAASTFQHVFYGGTTELMRIRGDGKVGIGMSAPASPLHIFSPYGLGIMLDAAAGGQALMFNNGGSATASGTQKAAMALAGSSGNWSTDAVSNDLVIRSSSSQKILLNTNGGSGASTLAVSGGSVGIGTTGPTQVLDVVGTGLFRNGSSSASTTGNQILLGYAGTATYQHDIKSRHNGGGASGNSIDFYTWNYGTDATTTIGTKFVMTIDGTGYVGIGTSTPSSPLHVSAGMSGSSGASSSAYVSYIQNTASGTYSGGLMINDAGSSNGDRFMEFLDNGSEAGCIYSGNGGANYSNGTGAAGIGIYTASDERLKKNIRETEMGLKEIMQIPVRDYEWKKDGQTVTGGFVAQELYKVFPEAVLKGTDDEPNSGKGNIWMIDYARLTPLLVKSIQDQQKIIDDQKAEIETLKSQNNKLSSGSERMQSDIDKMKASIETLQQILGAKADR